MTSEITVGNKVINVTANAGTPYWFKNIFQEDLMRYVSFINSDENTDEDKTAISIDVAGKLLYVMAMQYEKADNSKLGWNTFFKWLEQFETADVLRATRDIWGAYDTQTESTSTPKKEDAQPTEK